jgi:hypothetical protein
MTTGAVQYQQQLRNLGCDNCKDSGDTDAPKRPRFLQAS